MSQSLAAPKSLLEKDLGTTGVPPEGLMPIVMPLPFG